MSREAPPARLNRVKSGTEPALSSNTNSNGTSATATAPASGTASPPDQSQVAQQQQQQGTLSAILNWLSPAEADSPARVSDLVTEVDNLRESPHSVTISSASLSLRQSVASIGLSDNYSSATRLNGIDEKLTQPQQFNVRGNSFFSALLLSNWDNILGPRMIAVWHCKENVPDDVLSYVSGRALNGEIGRPDTDHTIETKFYVLSDVGWIVTSFIFTAIARPTSDVTCIYSLALIMPLDRMPEYLPLHEAVEDRFLLLVADLQQLIRTRFDSALQALSPQLEDVLANIYNLYDPGARLPHRVKINSTLFGQELADQYDESFVCRCISSHLQTGATIVVGNDPHRVNTMILSLSLFMSDQERQRSRFAGQEWVKFEPGLILQGLIQTENQPLMLADEDIIKSRCSVTVIDVTLKQVQQTKPQNEFTVLRNSYFAEVHREHLAASTAHVGLPMHANMPAHQSWTAPNGLFTNAKDVANMVRTCVAEVHRIHPSYLREQHITHFNRWLVRKAVALIQYVHSQATQPLSDSAIRAIRTDLSLNSGDFRAVLSQSEKLCPGITFNVLGDPRTMEDKLDNMMLNFVFSN